MYYATSCSVSALCLIVFALYHTVLTYLIILVWRTLIKCKNGLLYKPILSSLNCIRPQFCVCLGQNSYQQERGGFLSACMWQQSSHRGYFSIGRQFLLVQSSVLVLFGLFTSTKMALFFRFFFSLFHLSSFLAHGIFFHNTKNLFSFCLPSSALTTKVQHVATGFC